MPAAGSSTRSLRRTGPAAVPLRSLGRQRVAFGQQHRPLNRVPKLADVAGPRVPLQLLHRVGRHAADALLELGVVGVDVERDEPRDIVGAVAQRRKRNRQHVEPVEQVLPKLSLPHFLLQIPIGRADHPDVDVDVAWLRRPA